MLFLFQDYATLEETMPDGIVKSTLVIRASQSKHYGLYNCSVTNEYGNANAAITLKPLSKFIYNRNTFIHKEHYTVYILDILIPCSFYILNIFFIINKQRHLNFYLNFLFISLHQYLLAMNSLENVSTRTNIYILKCVGFYINIQFTSFYNFILSFLFQYKIKTFIIFTESLPLFIILIGVTSGIIIFSAFIILLVICNRRRRQKSQQMSEKPDVTVTTCDMYNKESDRSSNISDLKLQLPHGDGSYELV